MTTPDVLTIAETGDELEANLWADALRDAGVRTEIVTRGTRGALGGGVLFPGAFFQLLVNGDDLDVAREVLGELGGAERIASGTGRDDADPMKLVWVMAAIIGAFFAAGLLLNVLAP
ncbi:MAG: DUF2007 domain-containing protein [Dehalococcoidia bacterium]|nr:DUF2007 domain-containing protein [Dehalococcoidia bacterium]MCA9843086.1 DUF2007 domain-containing protein [Dehalococcoidia bacterium]MCA9852150.1 DUF2007 domain-containing protein [Dehalococcoidia bacterium]